MCRAVCGEYVVRQARGPCSKSKSLVIADLIAKKKNKKFANENQHEHLKFSLKILIPADKNDSYRILILSSSYSDFIIP